MIDKHEIDAKAEELGVHAANVQRDYVFGWLLSSIFRADNPLQPLLVLKGGNSFRKAYFEHGRFSNDLDFSTQTELDVDLLLQDRKSTRLNSSHVAISYAVFCLKKKKHWYGRGPVVLTQLERSQYYRFAPHYWI